jgi:predicted RND superfamily exporter protein
LSEVRKKIDAGFEQFGHVVYRHRWIAIILMLIIVGGLASRLTHIRIDTSTESFLHEDDPILLGYNAFREQFGRDEFVLIAIQPNEIFDISFFNKLKAFHEDLENRVPHVDEITSMINARNTRGDADQLIVEDLLETFPEDDKDMSDLRERVMSNPLYRNLLVSEDATITTIVIRSNTYSSMERDTDALAGFEEDSESGDATGMDLLDSFNTESETSGTTPDFLTDQENSELVQAVQVVAAGYRAPDFKIWIAGSPLITDTLKRSMIKDAQRFIKLVVLAIAICLFIMFRRITGFILPLVIVAFALLSTIGLMVLVQIPLTLTTNILPSFILAVGVGAAVHILSMFYFNFDQSGDREEAICYALGHSGLAVVITSLTTAAGLASFATAEVAPIGHLGIFASAGVMIALVYTIVLLPAFLSIIPIKPRKHQRKNGNPGYMDTILKSIARFSTSYAKPISIVCFIIIVIAVAGALRLSFSHNPLIWFPQTFPIRIATEKIDHDMRGTVALEVIIDTKRTNGLYDVGILNRMESLARKIKKFETGRMFVGKTISLTDMLKEIHKALNENRDEFYVIPQNPDLIPQELLLFENSGSDDLEDVVDSQFQLARFSIKVPWADAIGYMPFLTRIENTFKTSFGDHVEITSTGIVTLFVRTLYAAIHSAAKSYMIAFSVITLMMILLIGSLRIGLISMIPNLLPVVLTMGVMGWFGFPLDMFTMLIGSIAIGLAVDDTVHFMHNFRRYHYETADVSKSVEQTLSTAGRAMLVTSIVLTIGFFIYMFATMGNYFNFGLLTGVTIITALLADFILAPAIMMLIKHPNKKLSA